jgi:hypothetical protein
MPLLLSNLGASHLRQRRWLGVFNHSLGLVSGPWATLA